MWKQDWKQGVLVVILIHWIQSDNYNIDHVCNSAAGPVYGFHIFGVGLTWYEGIWWNLVNFDDIGDGEPGEVGGVPQEVAEVAVDQLADVADRVRRRPPLAPSRPRFSPALGESLENTIYHL